MMDSLNYQDYQSSLRALLNQALVEALKRNEAQTKTWNDYKKAHEKVRKGLEILPQELTTNCMVPIGRKAMMKGKLVHTNEILVCLGEGYFAKYSAKQAIAVCDRRIKQADEMLISLGKEQNLLEMRQLMPMDLGIYGDEKRKEIIETYDEEEENDWRIKHRQREKEYRQKLAELRSQEKTEIQSEEDLWQRLDELELQEELEDEIDRLQKDDCNYYGDDNEDDDDDSYEDEEDCDFSEDETTVDMIEESLANLKNNKIPKHEKDILEKENLDKEANHGSSSTYDIQNSNQPSSSTSLETTILKTGSSGETIDDIEPRSSFSSSNDQKSINIEQTMNKTKKSMEQNIRNYDLSQSSETSVISSGDGSSKYSNSLGSSSQSEIEFEKSTSFESQSRRNKEKQLLDPLRIEGEDKKNNVDDDEIMNSETRKRRVSFTDKIKVNVFGKWNNHSFNEPIKTDKELSSGSDTDENEIEKSQIIEDMISAGVESFSSNDEQTEDSTVNEDENDDDDDLIRIEFKHSKRRRKIPNRLPGDKTIEDPSDVYRIFWKPKSILKKTSSDVNNSQEITPPADDVFEQESDNMPFGTSYTIIVKDVEERKPQVLDANKASDKTRPPSKFKMARSGIKQ